MDRESAPWPTSAIHGQSSMLLGQYHAIARRKLARFRGREVSAESDSFLATFDDTI